MLIFYYEVYFMIENEKIDKYKSNILKILNSNNKTDIVNKLEELGISKNDADKLLDAFNSLQSAKQISKQTWDAAWNSKSGVDFSNDINRANEREFDASQYLDELSNRHSLFLFAENLKPEEITDEVLEALAENEIDLEKINNPTLKITAKYYKQSKDKDEKITKLEEQNKILDYKFDRVVEEKEAVIYELEFKEKQSQRKIKDLEKQNSALNKLYQDALSQITSFKQKISEIENRSFFQKFKTLFTSKRKELPPALDEQTTQLEEKNEISSLSELVNQDVSKYPDRNSRNDKEIQKEKENLDSHPFFR